MTRSTIDFGIDLGTTNSAISVLQGTRPEPIKNNDDHDITPSAVFIDKRGEMHVGARAKGRLGDEQAKDDVHVEFKRKLGTDHQYKFVTSGRTLLPEELSAEVLKRLRGDAQQRLGEQLTAAVITVPAAFEQKQCAATKKAAELAGFAASPLLQEPVAAALAYGFQADITKEYWLVYDFGGGTFDAAIIKAEDGSISVVNHGGDNYLGGSDIDRAIIEQIVLPKIKDNADLRAIFEDKIRCRAAYAKLKWAVEKAKIRISRSDSDFIEDCRFRSESGEEIEFDFKLTRADVARVAEPFIVRSADICKRVLKEKTLSDSSIEKVILVGGPTLAPYFRETLEANLKIALDYSVDPLTVVARGAAVFAGTQKAIAVTAPKLEVGEFGLTLNYRPVGPETDPLLVGKVTCSEEINFDGYAIELSNQKTLWRSGRIQLKSNGVFKANLQAEKGIQNIFNIELFDAQGNKQKTEPGTLTYTVGLSISDQPLCNSIALALANNEADFYFRKGEPLPAKHKNIYKTVQQLKKGETGQVLKIPIVEGENELADRNKLLGSLDITAVNIKRDLPSGTDVEVILNMDASRILRAKAYIPILDEEYEAVIDHNRHEPNLTQLKNDLKEEKQRLKEVKASGKLEDSQGVQLTVSKEVEQIKEIENLLNKAKDESDAAHQAENRLLELKINLDEKESHGKWPALVAEAREALDELDKIVEAQEDESYREQAKELREEIEELIEQKRADRLRKKLEQVTDAHREILTNQPAFWIAFLKHLVDEKDKMTDEDAALHWFQRARKCIDDGDTDGLRQAVIALMGLLPREVAADMARRGYGSGLLR